MRTLCFPKYSGLRAPIYLARDHAVSARVCQREAHTLTSHAQNAQSNADMLCVMLCADRPLRLGLGLGLGFRFGFGLGLGT